jgi:hypothetical protein
MKTGFGLTLVAAGVAIVLFGHKHLPLREGAVMRAVSRKGWGSKVAARLQSVVVGVLLIGFGLSLVFE